MLLGNATSSSCLNCIDHIVDGDGQCAICYNGVAPVIDMRIAENIWKTANGQTIERHAIAGTSPQAYELTIRNAANDEYFRRAA